MTNGMTTYDRKINNAMISVRDALADEGWTNIEKTLLFQKNDEPYILTLMGVGPDNIPEACRIGGMEWGGEKGEPAVYLGARMPQKNFLGQVVYLNQLRVNENPFVPGLVPDARFVRIYSPEEDAKADSIVWPLILTGSGPQIGLGLVNERGETSPLDVLDEAETIGDVVKRPEVCNAMRTLEIARDTHYDAVRRLPGVAHTQQIKEFPAATQTDMEYGALASLFPDQLRCNFMKILSLGAEEGIPGVTKDIILSVDGGINIGSRRLTPEYELPGSVNRPPDEYAVGITRTSPEMLGKNVAEVIKAMGLEYEQYPPIQYTEPYGLEPGTRTTTKKLPEIYA